MFFEDQISTRRIQLTVTTTYVKIILNISNKQTAQ